MTSGNRQFSVMGSTQWQQSSGQTGFGASGTAYSRVWSGSDSPPLFPYQKDYKVATTLRRSPSGKIIRYSFTFNAAGAPKRSRSKAPHAYNVTYLKDYYPIGLVLVQSYVVSTGLPYSTTWTNNISLGNQGFVLPPSPTITSTEQNELISKLSSKIKGSDFNASVFLAELPKTLTMIGDTAIKVALALKYTRSGRPIKAWRTLIHGTTRSRLPPPKGVSLKKSASSNWLEMQYGWVPLLSDVKGASELISHRLSFPLKQRYVTAMKQKRTDIVNLYGIPYWAGWPNSPPDGTILLREAYTLIDRRIVTYISEQPSLPVLTGLVDPLSVSWELLPFSFVADWFLPVGTYLEARSAASHISGSFVTTTATKRRISQPYVPDYFNPAHTLKTIVTLSGNSGFFREDFVLSRSTSTSLSAQLPTFKPLSAALSWKHCANALALVTQAFH